MKTIILINGLPRVGKDKTADIFVKNGGYKKSSFATPMKNIISSTFGISLNDLELMKNDIEKYSIEIKDNSNNQHKLIKQTNFRDILRLFGTEGMKPIFGNNVWSNLLYNEVLKSKTNLHVVADYRFMSEYQPQDGINITKILVKDKRKLPTKGHSSDIELYKNNVIFDYVINNIGTLDELEKNVDRIIKDISAKL